MNAPFKAPQSAAAFRADWTYADWLALGMQEADKALPGGSAERKADYAESYANSRAPVGVIRPVEPAVGKSVRDVIASTLGEADAAQYKPSANPAPSLTALAESAREQRVFGMISEASRRYAAKGHRA